MSVPAQQFHTIEDARNLMAITRARMQLMATAMADALAEAQGAAPGACERVARILGKARDEHLAFLRGLPR